MAVTPTLKRAAEESGLSVRTLYNKIGSGELQSITVGRRRLIPMRVLEDFLLRAGASQAPRADTAQDTKSSTERKLVTPRRAKSTS